MISISLSNKFRVMGVSPLCLEQEMIREAERLGMEGFRQVLSPYSDSDFITFLYINVYKMEVSRQELEKTWKSRKSDIPPAKSNRLCNYQFPHFFPRHGMMEELWKRILDLPIRLVPHTELSDDDLPDDPHSTLPFDVDGFHFYGLNFEGKVSDEGFSSVNLAVEKLQILRDVMLESLGPKLYSIVNDSWSSDSDEIIHDGICDWVADDFDCVTKNISHLESIFVRDRSVWNDWRRHVAVRSTVHQLQSSLAGFSMEEISEILQEASMELVHSH